MNSNHSRFISTISLSALLALPAAAAIAADGDGLEKPAQASAASQRPTPAMKASAAQGVSAEERVRWVPTSEQLNVPGDPTFGRVVSK